MEAGRRLQSEFARFMARVVKKGQANAFYVVWPKQLNESLIVSSRVPRGATLAN